MTVGGLTLPYQLFVPRHAPGASLPVVLFLHGSGERGTDGEAQLRVGLAPVVRAQMESFPAIVVFPQAPRDAVWAGLPARAAMAALDTVAGEWGADPRRVYLTGLSMGGFGTWQLALEHPDRFAALIPVCGGVEPLAQLPAIRVDGIPHDAAGPHDYVAARTAATPTWIFHGSADTAVPVAESRAMARALRALGAPVRYTEYAGVGHNSWDAAYGTPELWEWLFAQHR